MRNISITEESNGYILELKAEDKEIKYVFKNTEEFVMLEFIGKEVMGFKVSVTRR